MYKRIVIKIGSNVISENGRLDDAVLEMIVNKVLEVRNMGIEVVLVTSGAVATGRGILGFSGSSMSVSERQVFAAVGQAKLMSRYSELFGPRGYHCAQVLVTKGDFRDKEHYANMKNCFENLLEGTIIPIVNNNDTITIQELSFGDNDELAALIGSQLNADAVIFLSSVDGILDEEKKAIREVDAESLESVSKYITKEKSSSGSGGMENKFNQAVKLMKQGITAHIANGKNESSIMGIIEGQEIGTTFVAQEKMSSVKRRLSHAGGLAQGTVYVDAGAEKILLSKGSQSLLPVGVVRIEGAFKKGDTIDILNEEGKRIGSGIAQYGAKEAGEAIGKKGGKALVHYDNLFVE